MTDFWGYITGVSLIEIPRFIYLVPITMLIVTVFLAFIHRKMVMFVFKETKKERDSLKRAWSGINDCYDRIEDLENKNSARDSLVKGTSNDLG